MTNASFMRKQLSKYARTNYKLSKRWEIRIIFLYYSFWINFQRLLQRDTAMNSHKSDSFKAEGLLQLFSYREFTALPILHRVIVLLDVLFASNFHINWKQMKSLLHYCRMVYYTIKNNIEIERRTFKKYIKNINSGILQRIFIFKLAQMTNSLLNMDFNKRRILLMQSLTRL